MADEELKPVEVKLDDKALAEIDAAKTKAVPEDKSVEVNVEKKDLVKEPEEGIELLKAQLADLEKRAEAEQTARAEAERIARDREAEITRYRTEADQAKVEITDTRYQVILNSIDAFKRDGEIAQRDYAAALASGNFEASAEAQRKIARAEAQLVQLENGKAALEDQARQMKEAAEKPQPQQRQQTPNERFEGYISRFGPREQAYLRQHPEYAMDDKLNRRLIRVHGEAVDDEGLVAGTDPYFKFLDERMAPPKQPITAVETGAGGGGTRRPPAAPVSRQSQSGGAINGVVTLSPLEREAARISGMSEVDYARNMLAAQAEGLLSSRH